MSSVCASFINSNKAVILYHYGFQGVNTLTSVCQRLQGSGKNFTLELNSKEQVEITVLDSSHIIPSAIEAIVRNPRYIAWMPKISSDRDSHGNLKIRLSQILPTDDDLVHIDNLMTRINSLCEELEKRQAQKQKELRDLSLERTIRVAELREGAEKSGIPQESSRFLATESNAPPVSQGLIKI